MLLLMYIQNWVMNLVMYETGKQSVFREFCARKNQDACVSQKKWLKSRQCTQ